MSVGSEHPLVADLRHGVSALRGNWLWFVVVGVALVLLGLVALSSAVVTSVAAAVVLGALILVAGVMETVGSFWCRGWSGFFGHLLSGILSIVVGLLFVRAPLDALAALTMLIACFLLVSGTFKVISALGFRFATWGFPLLSGVIDLILGGMILLEWPMSSLVVIGIFVGINLVFRGSAWIALGLAFRSLPAS